LNLEFLTQEDGLIMGPISWVLGKILNLIYMFFDLFGINNIVICIILFTIIIKMLMLPMTIKQQKFSKLSAKMNPELTKISEKYKNKKDQDSVRRQQMETQAVYDKYGANPMGGCLPMLITLPILFALYRVIYKVPAYINDIYVLYEGIANAFIGIENHIAIITDFVSTNSIAITNELKDIADYTVGSETYLNYIIDIFSKFNAENWEAFLSVPEVASNSVITAFKDTNISEIIHVNKFIFNMSILDMAGWKFPGILIPIFAGGLQFLQGKFMSSNSNNKNTKANEDPTAQTMKSMNTVMPIMSIFICAMMPIGAGMYWITSSVVQIVQQFFINRYMDKIDVDEMIAKNVEKSNKKKAKLGVDYNSNKMASVAKTSTKSIATEAVSSSEKAVQTKNDNSKNVSSKSGRGEYKRSTVSYSSKSIAANANILREIYNSDSKPASKPVEKTSEKVSDNNESNTKYDVKE